jgi:hypothetical protein
MKIVALFILASCTLPVFSQSSPVVKFGKIAASDFGKKSYEIDTSASAVVLFETGSTKVVGVKDWFALEFEIHRRVHILNKNGYSHATVEIPLYTVGDKQEKLSEFKAVTYNLENGAVVESKLESNSLFSEKKNKNLVVKKFTMPGLKEGSIIEFQFKITSDFLFNIQPWNFQGAAPKLWSEYKVTIPQFLNYILIAQGYLPFYAKDRKDKAGDFTIEQKKDGPYGIDVGSDKLSIHCGVTDFRWVMKDVPAMKEEAFTSTVDNYIQKMEFQLSGYQDPLVEKKVMNTWEQLADDLLKDEDFGLQIENAQNWLPNLVQPILEGASAEIDKTKKIYAYVRDHFTCTDHNKFYTRQSLKDVFKNKNGNESEINLLLTAMLRSAGISADPVILSTRENGFVYPNYPIIGRFNYVISRATVGGDNILLDASYSYLGFAKLNYDCYNGQARIINAAATPLDLGSDKLAENELVNVNLMRDENEGWMGKINDMQGYYQSLETREKIKSNGQEGFFNELAKGYDNDVAIEHGVVDSLTHYEAPVRLNYDIKFGKDKADIFYLTPFFTKRSKQNPFKSANRFYPVEMPYKINDVYVLTMTVPDGYLVDEIPKSILLKMDASDNVVYEYKITQSGNYINLRSHLQINKTLFGPSEYDGLREFFNRVVAKQNEQIVFKKK